MGKNTLVVDDKPNIVRAFTLWHPFPLSKKSGVISLLQQTRRLAFGVMAIDPQEKKLRLAEFELNGFVVAALRPEPRGRRAHP